MTNALLMYNQFGFIELVIRFDLENPLFYIFLYSPTKYNMYKTTY